MCKPCKTMLVSLNNFCHIHLCANHAVVIWLFPAGKLEQLFWAPKNAHVFQIQSAPRAQATRIRGHKRHRNRERLSELVQQLTLRQISCILRWCEDSDLCPNLVDWTSGPVGLTLNEDIYSSNWLITNFLLTCFDIFEYSWSFGDRSVFEKFELVRSEFCIFLLQPGQAFVNHSCQNHFSRITSTDRWSYLPFDMVLSAIRLNVAGSPTDGKRFIRMQGTSITSIFSKFLKEQHALFFCIIFVWLWLWESSENQQLTLWIYESMWHIPIDFKNWGPLSVQRFLSHVPSGRCEVVGAALKLRLVQKATMHWCMLRWFRSPASCSSAAWPHGGCSMGGASLEGTCG